MNRKSYLYNFIMAHNTVGFQVLLALQLVTRVCKAGHPDAQVRECPADAESEVISPWTEGPQAPEAEVLFECVGMFHSHLRRDFRS